MSKEELDLVFETKNVKVTVKELLGRIEYTVDFKKNNFAELIKDLSRVSKIFGIGKRNTRKLYKVAIEVCNL
jgi:hypothetical protein